jgi:hypothetical protein
VVDARGERADPGAVAPELEALALDQPSPSCAGLG